MATQSTTVSMSIEQCSKHAVNITAMAQELRQHTVIWKIQVHFQLLSLQKNSNHRDLHSQASNDAFQRYHFHAEIYSTTLRLHRQ